jgi:hypothetical protein
MLCQLLFVCDLTVLRFCDCAVCGFALDNAGGHRNQVLAADQSSDLRLETNLLQYVVPSLLERLSSRRPSPANAHPDQALWKVVILHLLQNRHSCNNQSACLIKTPSQAQFFCDVTPRHNPAYVLPPKGEAPFHLLEIWSSCRVCSGDPF